MKLQQPGDLGWLCFEELSPKQSRNDHFCSSVGSINCLKVFVFFQRRDSPVPGKCQPITVTLCTRLPYSETFLPNTLGHTLQDDINLEINSFYPLISAGCSTYLKDFLCSMYTPKCVSGRPLPPCKSLCEQVRSDCEPRMNLAGFQWPNSFQCEAFGTESCKEVSSFFSEQWTQVGSLI